MSGGEQQWGRGRAVRLIMKRRVPEQGRSVLAGSRDLTARQLTLIMIEVVVSCPAAVSGSILRFLDGGWAGSCSLFRLDELSGSRTLGIARAVMVAFRRMYALCVGKCKCKCKRRRERTCNENADAIGAVCCMEEVSENRESDAWRFGVTRHGPCSLPAFSQQHDRYRHTATSLVYNETEKNSSGSLNGMIIILSLMFRLADPRVTIKSNGASTDSP